jgi:hypothetical protein
VLTLRDWTALRLLRIGMLAAGPFLTLKGAPLLPGTEGFETDGIYFTVTLLWSPLFFSIPALLLQNQRDLALSNVRPWFWRGLRLLPHLLVSKDSTIRPETAVSLTAWVMLLTVTAGSSLRVLTQLLGLA